MPEERASPAPGARLPGGIWAMGFASLLMDASSELVHSLLPLFMVTVLGAGMVTVGIVEGVAEATAAVVKVFSGALSDWLRNRKWLMVAGYGLAALAKPVFPLAHAIEWVFAARFVDRVGKGIRGAPRDALIADIVSPQQRGAAYGLRQSLDSVGAVIGPLLAVALLGWFGGDLPAAMWFAVVPALLSVLLLAVAVREPRRAPAEAAAAVRRVPLHPAELRRLTAGYWVVVALGAVFTLARFSEAFLVLRGQAVGLPLAQVPLVMVAMSVVYALSAYPAGALSDRVSARSLLLAGLAVLLAADAMLAVASSATAVFAGSALWGLHMGLTQGLMSKLVADTAAEELRGTAFGLFNLVSGVALLAASVIAGAAWAGFGPAGTFWAGACFAGLAAVGLLALPLIGGRGGPRSAR